MSRADKITSTRRIPEYYSDFRLDFQTNRVTGQLDRLTNADAVIQSITNIVLTDPKERPYQPHLGCEVREYLFGMFDALTIDGIQNSIKDALNRYEPRANILKVEIFDESERNGLTVNIMFSLINIQNVFTATVFIERVR